MKQLYFVAYAFCICSCGTWEESDIVTPTRSTIPIDRNYYFRNNRLVATMDLFVTPWNDVVVENLGDRAIVRIGTTPAEDQRTDFILEALASGTGIEVEMTGDDHFCFFISYRSQDGDLVVVTKTLEEAKILACRLEIIKGEKVVVETPPAERGAR